MEDKQQMIDLVLSKTFKFDADDLVANPNGMLSKNQRTGLILKAIGYTAAIILIGGTFVIMLLLASSIKASGSGLLIGMLALIIVVFVLVFKAFNVFLDFAERKVETVEGPVALGSSTTRSGNMSSLKYYLTISELQFYISRYASKHITPMQAYKIYYSARSMAVLSIEKT